MTATINSNCASVLIDSDYLAGTNQSVTLDITVQCLEEYQVSIDVADTDYTLLPATIGQTDVISDGVYKFVLTTVQSDGTEIVESIIKVVNCGLNCLMTNTFANIGTDDTCTEKALAFYALLLADGCDECSYTDICTLYNATGLNPNYNDDNGCNCS